MKLMQELLSINETKKFTDNIEWMDAVKAAYPEIADKLRFKGRIEDGKNLMFAEIPGEDRCYGVFDMDDDEGEVLSEGEKVPSPNELKSLLVALYPLDATSWAKATDGVRDLCRYAREYCEVPKSEAVDFTNLKSPQQWNTKGIEGIIKFYTKMTPVQKEAFVKDHNNLWKR